MIASIEIEGLGPIATRTKTELGGMESTTIEAPSESGKTVGLIEATCFVLHGTDARGRAFPVEGISDDCDEASVSLTLASGTVISRTMAKKNRKVVRQIVRDGVLEEHAREDAFQLALGPLGANHELLRTIMAPFAWAPLAERNARPLRDLLASVLPPFDLREVVADLMAAKGKRIAEGDPILEPEAVEARRVANAVVDKAAAALEVAEDTVKADLADPPPQPHLSKDSANVTLAHAKQWAAWDTFDAEWKRWTGWQARREALGPKPDPTTGTPTMTKVREYERLVDDNTRVLHNLQGAVALPRQEALDLLDERVRVAEDALAKLPTNTVCPTCGRRGWEQAKIMREAAEKVLADAIAKRDTEKPGLEAEREAYFAEASIALARAHDEVGAAKTLLEGAKAAWESQRTEDPTAAWEKAFKALGPEPRQRTAPDEPAIPRPTPEAVAAATQALTDWNHHEGAVRERERFSKAAKDRLAHARTAHALAMQEAERLGVLVGAVRDAPSVIAKQQAGVLGDLGPVSLKFGTEIAVEVRIDGRPAWLASTGKRLLADAWLRNAIRRAAGLEWLPLFVDNRQDWSGELPDFAPMICLRTSWSAHVPAPQER